MPLNQFEPYPTGESWLRMGNQAVGLKRQIQQSDAFEQEQATTQKAGEYAANMARQPGYVPDQDSPDYNPLAEMRARKEWTNLSSDQQRNKAEKYKQMVKEKKDLAANGFWATRMLKQQGDKRNPELMDQLVNMTRDYHNRFLVNGAYADDPSPDGTVKILSQTTGEVIDTLDPNTVSLDDLEQFYAMQAHENPQEWISKKMAEDKAIDDFNEDAILHSTIMGKPGGGIDDVIQRIIARDKTTGKRKTHYVGKDGSTKISEQDAMAYSVELGKRGEDLEMWKAKRDRAMQEAETGMTAAQRVEQGLKERELGQHERQLGLAERKLTLEEGQKAALADNQKANLKLKIREEYDNVFFGKKDAPDYAQYEAKRFAELTGQAERKIGGDLSGKAGGGLRAAHATGTTTIQTSDQQAVPQTVKIKSKKSGKEIEVSVQEVMQDGTMVVLMPDGSQKFINAKR